MDDDFYRDRVQFLRELRELLIRFNATIEIETMGDSIDLDAWVDGRPVDVGGLGVNRLTPKTINDFVSLLYEKAEQ